MSLSSNNYKSNCSTTNDPQSSSNEQSYYQIFVRGFEGKTIFLGSNNRFTKDSTVGQLKKAVFDRTGMPEKDVVLIFGTKQLHGATDKMKFMDLGIQDSSNLVMVGRLRGGGQQLELKISLLNEEELKLNIDNDKTVLDLKKLIKTRSNLLDSTQMCLMYAGVNLRDNFKLVQHAIKSGSVIVQAKQDLSQIPGLIVSYEPDMLSFDDTLEARAKMPCGHVISKESMTQYLRSLVDAKRYTIKCPGQKANNKQCDEEWDYKICQQIGVLTIEERKEFEIGFEMNLFYQQIGGKECPICETLIMKDQSDLSNRVRCIACIKKPESFDFCWQCMRRWSPNSRSLTNCGNFGCASVEDRNKILQTCGVKIVDAIPNIPTTRSCPNCTTLIELDRGCRHMTCPSPKCVRDKYQFCFICLNPWLGHMVNTCILSPRQILTEQ
eukprot:403358845